MKNTRGAKKMNKDFQDRLLLLALIVCAIIGIAASAWQYWQIERLSGMCYPTEARRGGE